MFQFVCPNSNRAEAMWRTFPLGLVFLIHVGNYWLVLSGTLCEGVLMQMYGRREDDSIRFFLKIVKCDTKNNRIIILLL